MRGVLALLLLALGVALVAAQTDGERTVVRLDVEGPIGPATSDYLARGLDAAHERGAVAVVLRMDTPGGLDTSMREIIRAVLASPVPVVTWVAPSGARAASAGTYIAYASHVAAMAPATEIGAATPVAVGGTPFPGGERPKPTEGKEPDKTADEKPIAPADPMTAKMVNDAVAYIRGLAELRGRNVEWAEKAVREAASLHAGDAAKANVIDFVADDMDDLLAKLDGREVTIAGEARTLATAGATVVAMEPDWRTELLALITNPNVAYILMLIGIYGLIIEFYSPGLVGPGIIGVISLVLALYAFHVLPVNYAGLALIGLGIGLMVAEAFLPSFGVLGIGGIAAFVIGSVLLMDTDVPGFRIAWELIGSIALAAAAILMLVVTMLVRSRRRAVVSGPEEMIGGVGAVLDWSGTEGRVRFEGETWNARAGTPLEPGGRIRVRKIDGLTLEVEPETSEKEPEA